VRYLSVCSGIEAASVAWHPLGWEPVAFSEIDPFASAVLAARFPHVPNLGDMTRYASWPIEPETVDVLVGGTPCQSFSVAGLRKGLADPRGNLALVWLGIIERFKPRYTVWENVPGVLSSNGGRDFGALLGGMAELGYGFAYRILDAQFVRVESHPRAVPQRRRRVFVVGCSGGDWQRAAEVLSLPESVCGDPPPRRKTGKGFVSSTENGSRDGRKNWTSIIPEVCGTLADGAHHGGGLNGQDAYSGRIIPVISEPLHAGTLNLNNGQSGGLVVQTTWPADVSGTLGSVTGSFRTTDLDGNGALVMDGWPPEVADPITTTEHKTWTHEGKTFRTRDTVLDQQAVAFSAYQRTEVRRLTPRECERLQGFPENWTLIPWRKGEAPDSARYKTLGNSMAVNVMRWIGDQISTVDARQEKEA